MEEMTGVGKACGGRELYLPASCTYAPERHDRRALHVHARHDRCTRDTFCRSLGTSSFGSAKRGWAACVLDTFTHSVGFTPQLLHSRIFKVGVAHPSIPSMLHTVQLKAAGYGYTC